MAMITHDDIVQHQFLQAKQGNGKGEQHILVAHESPKGDGGNEAQQIPHPSSTEAPHERPRESLQTEEDKGKQDGTDRIEIIELRDELGHIVGQSTRHAHALGEIGWGEKKKLILLLIAQGTPIGEDPEESHDSGKQDGEQNLPMLMKERLHNGTNY